MIIAVLIFLNKVVIPNYKYNQAIAMMKTGDYNEAIEMFESISDYKDSSVKIIECKYTDAMILMNAGEYDKAIELFDSISDYKDSANIISEYKYTSAIALKNAGEYEEAIKMFKSISDYKGSSRLINECKYEYGEYLLNNEKIVEAYEIFNELDNYKKSDDIANSIYDLIKIEKYKNTNIANIGECVLFGEFYERNATDKKSIEWIVLDVKDGKALLVSEYALTNKAISEKSFDITWENSEMRTWLNSTFYNHSFADDEQAMISTTVISAEDNTNYDDSSSDTIQDKVFLLSKNEVIKYLNSDEKKQCKPTRYAVKRGTMVFEPYDNCQWWLRPLGDNSKYAMYVDENGIIQENDKEYSTKGIGVRPALWVDIDSYNLKINNQR